MNPKQMKERVIQKVTLTKISLAIVVIERDTIKVTARDLEVKKRVKDHTKNEARV